MLFLFLSVLIWIHLTWEIVNELNIIALLVQIILSTFLKELSEGFDPWVLFSQLMLSLLVIPPSCSKDFKR